MTIDLHWIVIGGVAAVVGAAALIARAQERKCSRGYRLKRPDDAGIRSLFTPEIRQFFAATPDQYVAGGSRFLFWWRHTRLPSADQLDEWLEQGDHVRRRFFKE